MEEGTKSVSLNFALKERTTLQALVMPEWKIKIRQIECPKISTFIDKFKNYQAAKDFPLLGACSLKCICANVTFKSKIVCLQLLIMRFSISQNELDT